MTKPSTVIHVDKLIIQLNNTKLEDFSLAEILPRFVRNHSGAVAAVVVKRALAAASTPGDIMLANGESDVTPTGSTAQEAVEVKETEAIVIESGSRTHGDAAVSRFPARFPSIIGGRAAPLPQAALTPEAISKIFN